MHMISRELSDFTHVPVLYEQTLEALRVCPTGIYGLHHRWRGPLGRCAEQAVHRGTAGLDKDDEALRAADVRLSAIRSDGAFRLIKVILANWRGCWPICEYRRLTESWPIWVCPPSVDTGRRFSYNHDIRWT